MSAVALGAIAISPVANAQSDQGAKEKEEAQDIQEVVVTGIRSSLESAQELKKNAEVFVDSVTSEDIGALPDRSVTEALQRIPGVSISRFAGANDPDHFSIEGTGVVVRGLNQVRSELNGRDTFSANSGRFLSFADVPPELLYAVDVFKNQSADMIEGGLAGTVNLRTRTPFDQAGQLIGGSLEANYGDFSEEVAPTGSFLYSNRWETGAGDIGFLGNIVYSELKSRSDGIQASSFQQNFNIVPGLGVYFPEGAAFRTQDYNRERTGGALAFQWQSPDDSMLATLQYMRSDATTSWGEHAMEIATDNVNGAFFVPGTEFGFDDRGVFTHGTVTAATGWRSDQQDCGANCTNDYRTPTYGLQSNNIFRAVDQEYMTQDIGANFKWDVNENWGLNFDAQFVDSTVENLDNTLWGSTFQNAEIDLRGDLPKVRFLAPGQNGTPPNCAPLGGNCASYFTGTHNNFQDPYNSFWRSAMDHAEDSEGDEFALRFDVDHKLGDDGWLRNLKFGGRYAERDQTTRSTTYNWGALSEIWGNNGPVWFNDPVDGTPSNRVGSTGTPSATQTALFTFDNFMRGDSPIPAVVPFYNGKVVGSGYEDTAAFAESIRNEWVAVPTGGAGGWVRLDDPRRAPAGVSLSGPGGRYLPQEINHTNEATESLYFMMKFGKDLDEGVSVSGNVGLRYVRTDFDAEGTFSTPLPSQIPSIATCAAQMPPATGICALPANVQADMRTWSTGIPTAITANNTYENWLPSFNMKVGLSEEVLLRFGYSKAMARPDLGLTRFYYTITPLVTNNVFQYFQANSGNPYLKPTQSTQFDGSIEWYFSSVGSLTFSAFYKELKDVLTNSTVIQPITNNGITFDVVGPGPDNAKQRGTLNGAEVAYQQFFDMLPGWASGFGIQTNYTYINSHGVPQSTLNIGSTTPASAVQTIDTSKLPLMGLSEHNANLALIYEKGAISTRLAYNWRSEYLLTTRDVITPFAPIIQEATGQLDGSFFYSINDNFKIGLQGVNLLNEITKTSQVINSDLAQAGRSWFMNDRRISLALRVNF